LYSLDYKFKHNYRREGLRATQHEFSAPITFYKGFFGEYLDFQASENFYYSKVNYYEGNATTEDATYFSNYHKFLVSSDLTKKYDSFIHNLQADLSFVIPSVENKSGYFADFIPFNIETKNVAFKLNQYFYDESGFDFLTHRFVQVYYDDKNIYKYGDSENQIIYKPTKELKLYNTIFYSHEYDRIRKLQSGLNYNKDRYNLRVNHTYEYKKDEKNSDFITTYANAKIDKNYNIFASLDYDFEDRFTKEWSVGWKMKKSCWDYMFRYKESVTPNLTSSGAESVVKRGVLFFVRFSPFGGMAYEFNKETSIEDEKLLDVLDMKEEVR
jgi:LPS-assembly protein